MRDLEESEQENKVEQVLSPVVGHVWEIYDYEQLVW